MRGHRGRSTEGSATSAATAAPRDTGAAGPVVTIAQFFTAIHGRVSWAKQRASVARHHAADGYGRDATKRAYHADKLRRLALGLPTKHMERKLARQGQPVSASSGGSSGSSGQTPAQLPAAGGA